MAGQAGPSGSDLVGDPGFARRVAPPSTKEHSIILERPNDLAQETSDAVMSAVRLAGDRWSSITSELPSGRELASSGRELAGEATTALSKALDRRPGARLSVAGAWSAG